MSITVAIAYSRCGNWRRADQAQWSLSVGRMLPSRSHPWRSGLLRYAIRFAGPGVCRHEGVIR